MPIPYHTIPEECRAQIFFKEGGWTGEEWQAEIAMTGEIMTLIDKDGNRYTTPEQLETAGVERITLINHYVVWMDECESTTECDFCGAPMEDVFDEQGNDFIDCGDACDASEGHYTPKGAAA